MLGLHTVPTGFVPGSMLFGAGCEAWRQACGKHSMRVPAVKDLIIHEEDPDTFCLVNEFHLVRYAVYMFSVIIPQT